jgi:alpha-1,4-digalacturonate transport system substrate-binding protein
MQKRTLFLVLSLLLLSVLAFSGAAAQSPTEIRITWYDDGNEGEVLRSLLDKFEAKNTDIKVIIDTVDYKTAILKTLPVQIQAGEGPDIARLTAAFTSLTGYYLDMRPLLTDADYWDKSFPTLVMQAMRKPDDTKGLYGFPAEFTLTGPFINRTLFEQAKIEVPSDTNKAVTWEAWTKVTAEVAKATETKYAVAIDRTGHRFAGPAISDGATFFDDKGNVTLDTPGFRSFANLLISWHKDGLTPAEVWAGNSGTYAPATDYFINGQTVLYMAGSWQVSNFAKSIGDKFDWEAVPNPSGSAGSTGIPGGSVLMAIGSTKHPKEVARVMDYLAQEDVQTEFAARRLSIPAHLAVAAKGVDYQTDNKDAKKSLSVFLAQIPNISDQAYKLNYHPQNALIFNAIRDRLGQVLTGELNLDDAIKRAQQDIDDGIKAAAK